MGGSQDQHRVQVEDVRQVIGVAQRQDADDVAHPVQDGGVPRSAGEARRGGEAEGEHGMQGVQLQSPAKGLM